MAFEGLEKNVEVMLQNSIGSPWLEHISISKGTDDKGRPNYVQAKHGLNRQCIKSMVLFRLFLRGSSAAHIQGPNTKTTQACCIGKVGLAWHQLSGYTYIFPICKTSLLRNICKSPCYGKGVWDWKKRQKLNAGSENFCSSSTRFFQICSEVPGEMGTS